MSQANSAVHMSPLFPAPPQMSLPQIPLTQPSSFAPFMPRVPAAAPFQRSPSCDDADASEPGSQAGEQFALENVSTPSSGSQAGPSPPPGAGGNGVGLQNQSSFPGGCGSAPNPLQMLQRQISLQSQSQQQAVKSDDMSDAGTESLRRPSDAMQHSHCSSVGRGRGVGGIPHRVTSSDGCLSIVNYLMQFYLPTSEPEQFAKKVRCVHFCSALQCPPPTLCVQNVLYIAVQYRIATHLTVFCFRRVKLTVRERLVSKASAAPRL